MSEGLVVAVRGVLAFFSLLIYTRLLGKQQVSQLSFFDYIMGITIGSMAAEMTVDLSSRAWPHFVGLTIWFLLVLSLQIITIKSRKVSKYIDGEPDIIIMNGKIMEKALRKSRIRLSELLQLLREKDTFDISEVEFAILENSGKISVLKKSQYQPLTPKDMKIQTSAKTLSTELIYDGEILEQNLKTRHLTKEWLMNQLEKHNITDVSKVFFASINSSGSLYIDIYDDHVNLTSDIYASMEEEEK